MINLFINPFTHENASRQKEIDFCMRKNVENKLIDKIIQVNKNSRSTYGDFFKIMSQYPNDINIIANLDIYFDETIELAKDIKTMECYALTRWENYNGSVIDFNSRHGRPSPPQWSQDAWIFKGFPDDKDFDTVVAINSKSRSNETIPFSLGIPGCDNKIAAMLKEKKYNVTNPSLSIKAIHVHKNESRSYPHYQILRGIRPFGPVNPTSL